jgi:uncharacterized protein YaeQ
MGSFVPIAETFRFHIGSERLTLHKKSGESYEHVLMKAIGYALYRPQFPQLEIERRIGGRYKPDLIALDQQGKPEFWGECGKVGLRKVAWLAKHSGARQVVLFKFDITAEFFLAQVRAEIKSCYRTAGRLQLYNFSRVILEEAGERLDDVPPHWFTRYDI